MSKLPATYLEKYLAYTVYGPFMILLIMLLTKLVYGKLHKFYRY